MDRRLVWGVVGLLSYVIAAVALAVAVAPMFDAGGIPSQLPTDEPFGLLVVSALLFVVGGLCLRRASASIRPSTTPAATRVSSGGATVTKQNGAEHLRCGNCGAENEAFFTFCEGCAERL